MAVLLLTRGLVDPLIPKGDLDDLTSGSNVTAASIAKHHHCEDGRQYSVDRAVLVVVGVTSILSMIGAVLIVFSYVLIPQIRTKVREILLHLSLMDFMAAAANFAGIMANFDKYLSDKQDMTQERYDTINDLCVTQAAFAIYGTVSSVLWTTCMAVYIYLRIMYEGSPVAKKACYAFYLICYGIPLILTIWFGTTHKLGYSKYGGSGWCGMILTDAAGHPQPFRAIIGNDIFIYVTIILVPVIFVSLHFHMRSQISTDQSLPHSLTRSIHSVEMKLLLVPIVFILLRIWSLLFVILEVELGLDRPLNCKAMKFFLIMGGIGDSAQGFANAILFCVFTPKVRRRFLQLVSCRCSRRQDNTSINGLTDSFLPTTDLSGNESDSSSRANDQTRPLLS